MNVKSCEKKEKSTYGLEVEISAAEFDTAIDKAYRKNKGMIAVPGFRKGKAPRKIIENIYGANIFYEEALDNLLPSVIAEATSEKELRTVGYPTIDNVDIADDKTVTVKFTVGVYPDVTIGEYKGIEAEKPAVEVTDMDIDTEIERVRYQNARIETITNRPVINGDTVNLDYRGTLDGVAFDGGTAENYELKIGSKSFIPGFEDKMQGMYTGEERDLELTFPEDYHAKELAGKDVIFHVKVNEIKSQVLPEADDEFVKDVSDDCETMEQYRAKLAEDIRINKEANATSVFENNVMDKLVESVEGDIPDALIDEYVNNQVENMRQNLAQYGMELDAYLGMMNTNLEAFTQSMRPNAEKNAKSMLALEKVAEAENFEITDEELADGYSDLADRYGVDVSEVKTEIAEDALKNELRIRKANRFVMDSAVAVAPKPEEKTEEKAEAAEEPAAE